MIMLGVLPREGNDAFRRKKTPSTAERVVLGKNRLSCVSSDGGT